MRFILILQRAVVGRSNVIFLSDKKRFHFRVVFMDPYEGEGNFLSASQQINDVTARPVPAAICPRARCSVERALGR